MLLLLHPIDSNVIERFLDCTNISRLKSLICSYHGKVLKLICRHEDNSHIVHSYKEPNLCNFCIEAHSSSIKWQFKVFTNQCHICYSIYSLSLD